MTSSRRRSSWDWIDQGVRWVENVLAICLLAAIIVDVLLQVLFRYVLSNPLSWSSEVATYTFAWLTLIGIAIAQRDHAHIEVRLFVHLSDATGIATAWFSWITSFLFFTLLAIAGYLFVSGEMIQTGPASGIHLWVVYACLPTGAMLGLYHTLRDLPQLIHAPLSLVSTRHSEEIPVP